MTIALAPCGPQVARAVYASLAGMAARAPEDDPDVRRAIALQEISDMAEVPAFALADAAAAYRKGDIGDGKWRPTSGELVVEARRLAGTYYAELGKLSRVLGAPLLESQPGERISKERWDELRGMAALVAASTKI